MERYFIFDNKNTWFDWDLILTSKNITPPEPKENYVELDGMSGSLDLSEVLTGEISYKDRTVSASFWTDKGTRDERERLLQDIVNTLHGRKVKIIEPDRPDSYFYGRVKVKSVGNIIPYGEISIECTCDPWRYRIEDTERRIDVDQNSIKAVIKNTGVKTVTPKIHIIGRVVLQFGDYEPIELINGDYTLSDLRFKRGSNIVNVSGNGSVIFMYKEADL